MHDVDSKVKMILDEETLLSDFTFRIVCECFPDFPSYIISVITGDDVDVEHVRTQVRIMNPGGRDIIADVLVYAKDGCVYDIEPNSYREGESVERGLYHTHLLGAKMLAPASAWQERKRCCVIMLNKHDVMGEGRQIIRIEALDTESGKRVSEKDALLFMVFVSAQGKESERDALFRDLSVKYSQQSMMLPKTKKVVEYLKERGVRNSMYDYIKAYFAEELAEGRAKSMAEGRAEGIAEGKREATVSNAKAMLFDGLPADRVARILGLSLDEIENIRKEA